MPQIGMYDVPPLILKHLISAVARLAQLVSPSVELPADLVMPFSQELYNEEIGLLLRYSNLVIMNNKGKITHPEVSASIKYSENNHRFILSGWINAVSRATIGLGLGLPVASFSTFDGSKIVRRIPAFNSVLLPLFINQKFLQDEM